jgi:hypothetical protein
MKKDKPRHFATQSVKPMVKKESHSSNYPVAIHGAFKVPGKLGKGVTVSIAADILGVSLRTLRLWDKSGVLVANRSKNGYRRYLVSELEAFKQKKNISRKKMTLVD